MPLRLIFFSKQIFVQIIIKFIKNINKRKSTK